MMRDIETLQERIQERCRQRAKKESERLMGTLPFFGDIRCWVNQCAVETDVRHDHLTKAITKAVEQKLYVDYVNNECKALLEAVDQIAELVEEVGNIQRG